MVNSSLAQAYEEALMKKSNKKNPHVGGAGSIHPSFPPQGSPQPAHMGSQSSPPMAGDPSDYSTAMPPSPGMEAMGGF